MCYLTCGPHAKLSSICFYFVSFVKVFMANLFTGSALWKLLSRRSDSSQIWLFFLVSFLKAFFCYLDGSLASIWLKFWMQRRSRTISRRRKLNSKKSCVLIFVFSGWRDWNKKKTTKSCSKSAGISWEEWRSLFVDHEGVNWNMPSLHF